MTWWISPFTENPFLLRALFAGVLVALSCAIAGTFVVLRGLAFLGDALAHGILPGVAGALLLGAPGLLGAAVGAVAMIAGVSLLTSRSRLSSDTAIGLLFVGMLALGIVIVSRSNSFTGDVVSILFGEILGASWRDLAQQVVSLALIAALAVAFARPFLLLSFDPEQADVAGWSSRRYHLVMLVMVALTVIMSFQTVGTLLVFGMLLAPAGAGALLAHRLPAMMAWAAGIGTLSVYLGLLLSYHLDVAGSACIVVVAVALFFVIFAGQAVRRPAVRRPGGPTPRLSDAPQGPAAGGGGRVTTSSPVVRAHALAVGYDGRPAVDDVEIDLSPGRVLALVGTNGSGKSTLLKTIIGLLPPVAGSLEVLGGVPGAAPRRVGYLGQFHATGGLLPLQARDVVLMGRFPRRGLLGRITRADREIVATSLERTGVADLATTPLRDLSGGQQQRVYLAQVLAREADLIVLDEPTSGLDAGSTARYRQVVREELARGASVVVATHDIGDALTADQAILLAGRVVAAGTPAEVLSQGGVQSRLAWSGGGLAGQG